jgi:glycosyltransferase involved in cell wall biosynthesis
MNRVSLVIPIFNEFENIKLLYQQLLEQKGYEWEAIFVNDGSTDGSTQELDAVAKLDSRVTVIHFRRNYGQTAALAAGFDHATGEVIIPLDGDLQNDPADIPRLLEKINEGYDVVSGWRKVRQDAKWSRRIPSQMANRLISKITGVALHDYGCTLKAYRRDIVKDIRLYGEMHRFIPAYAAWHGAHITELVVNHRPRQFGATKYGIGRTLRVILDLITVKFLINYSTKPMHFFGRAGWYSFLLSVITGVLAVYFKLTGEKSFIETPLPLLTAFFFLLSVQFVLLGLIAELLIRNYYEHGQKRTYTIRSVVKKSE